MKLVFVYGTRVKMDNENKYYTGGTLPKELWTERYNFFTNDITFIGRLESKRINETERQKLIQLNSNIKFIGISPSAYDLKHFFSIKTRKKTRKIIERTVKNSDIVIARIPDIYGYYAIDYAIKYKKKIVTEVISCAFDSLWYHSLKGKIISIPSYLKLKKYVKKSPNVIYVTDEFLQKRYPNKNNNIGCSDVCLAESNDSIIDERINKINNKNLENKIIIGTCGAIDVKHKGQEYVIKALAKLNKIGITNIEYQIVGGGNPDRLKKIAKKYNVSDQLKIKGTINHDQVFNWLKDIDIYIQPSNQEGLSRAVIEAMSMGCPCIVSNAGGNPELINEEYVFKKKNSKKLSKLLLKLMSKNEMKEQAILNFNKSKNYDKKKLDVKRIKFYKNICD